MNAYELNKLELNLQSIEDIGNQIDDTFDTVDSLNDVKDIADSQKEVLTVPALEAIFKNINRLYDRLGISNRRISVETYSLKTNYNLANESVIGAIGSAISAIWQAIISTLKKIIDFFAGMFGMSKKGADKAQKNADKATEIKSQGIEPAKREIIIAPAEEVEKSKKDEYSHKEVESKITKPEPTLGTLVLDRTKLISMYSESGKLDYTSLLASLQALNKGIDDTHELSHYLFGICDVEIADRITYPHATRKSFVADFEIDLPSVLKNFGPIVRDTAPSARNLLSARNLFSVSFGDDWPGLKEYTFYGFDKAKGEDAFHYLTNFSLKDTQSKKFSDVMHSARQVVRELTLDQVKTLSLEVKACFDKIDKVTNSERGQAKEAIRTCEELNKFLKDSKAEGEEEKLNSLMVKAYRAASNISTGGGASMYFDCMRALKAFNTYCESHLELYK